MKHVQGVGAVLTAKTNHRFLKKPLIICGPSGSFPFLTRGRLADDLHREGVGKGTFQVESFLESSAC